MKTVIFILTCIFFVTGIWAEENTEIKTQTDLSLTASTIGEIQFGLEKRIIFPYLQGESAITADNNITLKIGAEVTPISFDMVIDTVWTPAAFFNLTLGTMIGTGWNYDRKDYRLNGMGLYRFSETENPQERADGSGFDGVVWKIHFGPTLQFDLAAVVPGDWNHIIMKLDHFIYYQNYSKARGDEQWYFKSDDGINQNSFGYYFSGFLGYQMPIVLNMAGIQFESSYPFYNPQSGKSLADRQSEKIFSLIADFKFGKRFNLMVINQLSNRLKHPVTIDFDRQWRKYRVLFICTWRLEGV